MKNLYFLWLSCFLAFGMIQLSCTVTGKNQIVDNDYSDEEEKIHGADTNTTLVDALRKNTSLEIMGIHPNVDILIRGINTIIGDPRPLYVVNGIRMGRNYAQAANAVDIRRIKRIRVLKSLSELSLYGEDGKNGVIEITVGNN